MESWVIVFLDIDGVLVNDIPVRERTQESVAKFDREALRNLDLLLGAITQVGCRRGIVLSSSWRIKKEGDELLLHQLEYLKELFSLHSFSKDLIGTTPIVRSCEESRIDRVLEISKWVIDNLSKYQMRKIIVIDDVPMEIFGSRLVLCDREKLFGKPERTSAVELLLKEQAHSS